MKKSTAKLLRTAVCIIMTIACFTASCFQVSAMEPAVYYKPFNNQDDMLASLKIYCEQFPDVEDYSPHGSLSQPRNREHLKYRNVILPDIPNTDYTVTHCYYGDSIIGTGVNLTGYLYRSNSSDDMIRVLMYYHFSKLLASKQLTEYVPDYEYTVYDGQTADGTPYYAYSYKDDSGNDCCKYNMIIGDCFVSVYDSKGYSPDRINLLSLKPQDILLPVYVKVENDVNADGEFNITDVTYLQKVLAKLCKLPEKYNDIYVEDIIDANGDGNINIQDATAMQKLLAQYG